VTKLEALYLKRQLFKNLAQPDRLTRVPGDPWLRPTQVSKEIKGELI